MKTLTESQLIEYWAKKSDPNQLLEGCDTEAEIAEATPSKSDSSFEKDFADKIQNIADMIRSKKLNEKDTALFSAALEKALKDVHMEELLADGRTGKIPASNGKSAPAKFNEAYNQKFIDSPKILTVYHWSEKRDKYPAQIEVPAGEPVDKNVKTALINLVFSEKSDKIDNLYNLRVYLKDWKKERVFNTMMDKLVDTLVRTGKITSKFDAFAGEYIMELEMRK